MDQTQYSCTFAASKRKDLVFKPLDGSVKKEAGRIFSDIMNIHPSLVEDASFLHDALTEETTKFYYKGNASTSSFLEAVHLAFSNHYSLKLSISHFLIAITQSLAIHINNNAAAVRKVFVDFSEEKKNLIVRRDEFVDGKQNDWSTVFGDFAELIKANTVSNLNEIVLDDFSVKTNVSEIVSQISLMDCMKNYFKYTVVTRCGIPTITLIGSPEDWTKLRQKVDKLVEMNKGNCLNLDFWLEHLSPLVKKLEEEAGKEEKDIEFWSYFYKFKESSGGPFIDGWINILFPYIVEKNGFIQNPNMNYKVSKLFDGTKGNNIHQGFCKVPFIWDYLGKEIPMNLFGGFLCCLVDNDQKTVEPELFWAVTRN